MRFNFIRILLSLSLLLTSALEAGERRSIEITDNAGRRVEVSVPVGRAVVALRYNNELIRACGAISQVVGVDMNTAQDREYWSNFSLEDVVGRNQKSLNYEKIIELMPEIVILPSNGTYTEAEKKLAPFGIKVVVISGYDTGDFYNQVENIGKLFGKEKEAERFIEFYSKPLKYIAESLEGVERRSVYWEDTKDYYTSFPGSYYYDMIEASGGRNIFENMGRKAGVAQIDPESVAAMNPDVIVKNITPQSAIKGTGVYEAPSEKQMKETVKEIKNRKAWGSIEAVKNDRVYLMSQFGHGGASKMIGAVYMAKWLYPEILVDLDPDEIFRIWLEEFQEFREIEGHFYPETEREMI